MPTSQTPEIIFQDPPPAGTGHCGGRVSPIQPWLKALRAHPGKWAAYPEPLLSTPNLAKIREGGGYGVEKAGEYEATTRAASNKRVTLFARYIGEERP